MIPFQLNLQESIGQKRERIIRTKIQKCLLVLDYLLELQRSIPNDGDRFMNRKGSNLIKEKVKLFILDNFREIIYDDDLREYTFYG